MILIKNNIEICIEYFDKNILGTIERGIIYNNELYMFYEDRKINKWSVLVYKYIRDLNPMEIMLEAVEIGGKIETINRW